MQFTGTSRQRVRKILLLILLYTITGSIIAATFLLVPTPVDVYPPLRLLIIFFSSVLLTKYFFYMFVSPWHDAWISGMKRKWKKERPKYEPLVSVLVPAWNENVGILHTLESLVKSSYPHMEIVVVNDGSTDSSDAGILAYKREFEERKLGTPYARKFIIYKYQENGGKGMALNQAIALSSGEILVSIDADCVVAPEAIANFVEYFRNPQIMAAVGNVKIGNTKTILGTIQYLEFLFSFYCKKADSLLNTIYIIGGAAGAFRREVFNLLGTYDTKNITEDIELSMRIQDAGFRIVYASDAIVYTEGATDFKSLESQRLRWKRGRFQTFYSYMHMFFSLKPQHSKLLTVIMLPLALFAEVQLLLEFWFLSFLYSYALITHDFSSFISGIIVVSFMFMVQIFFETRETRTLSFLVLAPVAWLLFYVMTLAETSALLRSIWGLIKKKEVVWQQWERAGVHNVSPQLSTLGYLGADNLDLQGARIPERS